MMNLRKCLMAVLLASAVAANAQIENFEYNSPEKSFAEIEAEWTKSLVGTVGNPDKPNIKTYFLSFASHYPNELLSQMLSCMLGVERDGIVGDYVCDVKNGYIQGTLQSQFEQRVQMCYWRCNDGRILVGITINGCNEGAMAAETEADLERCCTNALLFYKLNEYGCWWEPVLPNQIVSKDLRYYDYQIQLPRQGKDIKLKWRQEERTGKNYTLKWNGNGFNAVQN